MARRVLEGATYFVTRRVTGRMYLLTPEPGMTRTFWYLLGVLAAKHGVAVHAITMMSNHLHYVVTAPGQVLSKFMADLHREVARAVNRRFERNGTLFEDVDPSALEVVGERGVVQETLYTVLNPVKAGLVARGVQWPGMRWVPGMREMTVKRPVHGYEVEAWPEEVTLHFTAPPAWTGTEDQWHEEIARLVEAGEQSLRVERMRGGRAVLGAQLVMQQDPFRGPSTDAPSGESRPVFATGGDGPLLERLMVGLKAWRRAYREALTRWKQDKAAVFPVGTYWMVVHHGAACG